MTFNLCDVLRLDTPDYSATTVHSGWAAAAAAVCLCVRNRDKSLIFWFFYTLFHLETMLIGFYLEAVAVMACGRWRLATHSQQIVGGFSVGATPSRARPRDALRCLSVPAELAVTSLLTARSTFGAGGNVAPFFFSHSIFSVSFSFLFVLSAIYSSASCFYLFCSFMLWHHPRGQ